MLDDTFVQLIADEIGADTAHVSAALGLLHAGARPPFVARFRKDATGRMSEAKLNVVRARQVEYIAISQRRNALLTLLEEKGWLTPALKDEVGSCTDLDALEDLYLPYKKHRGSQADLARERGLAPLAELIWLQEPTESDVEGRAAEFVDEAKGVPDSAAAVDGAIAILKERIAFDRESRGKVRSTILASGRIEARASAAAEGKRGKFSAYHEFSEPLAKIPSHRFLALMRGSRQGMLAVSVAVDDAVLLSGLAEKYIKVSDSPFAPYVQRAIDEAYAESLRPQCEEQALRKIRKAAEDHAIQVFCDNARGLYLQPAAGPVRVLAIEAGLDRQCGMAVVDGDGSCIAHEVVALPEESPEAAVAPKLIELLGAHSPGCLAVSMDGPTRELASVLLAAPELRDGAQYVVHVNASGLAAYAATEVGEAEAADLSRVERVAAALARRHQNPLAELAKVDPRSIGVGQYHQDVSQRRLVEALGEALESCVDEVGVDVNTAPAAMVAHASGLNADTAANIVEYRATNGPIPTLETLNEVRGVGPKVFEQCVGFLFVRGGANPLDATRIHPQHYALVEEIAKGAGVSVAELIGDREKLDAIGWETFEEAAGGPHTLHDIKRELTDPGRDPRRAFRAPSVHNAGKSMSDLASGQTVEGVVTNVTDFGAFVDIGVKQDGLVHLSELAHHFIHDPHQVVRVGQYVTVKVIGVDLETPRISLSIKALKTSKPARGKGGPRRDRTSEAGRGGGERSKNAKRSPKDKRPKRQDKRARRPKQVQTEQDKAPLNTQLADQLEALKAKFGSEG